MTPKRKIEKLARLILDATSEDSFRKGPLAMTKRDRAKWNTLLGAMSPEDKTAIVGLVKSMNRTAFKQAKDSFDAAIEQIGEQETK
jgi:hypothetical protein